MHGQLFELFDQAFPSYFVLLVTGFIFAAVIGALWAKRVGQDPDVVVDLGLAMLLAGVAGARILHVFADGYFWDYVHLCTDPAQVDWPISRAECLAPAGAEGCSGAAGATRGVWDAAEGVCHPAESDCFAWAKFWAGGLTFYGGFIGAVIAAWFLLKRDRFPFWKATDMAGMTIPVGLGFGRMGCLLAGCCFGKPTDGAWALAFPGGSPASDWQFKHDLLSSAFLPSLPVHPTQIYESAGALAIAAFLFGVAHGRKRYDGQVFFGFIALYAVLRFVLEFWRSDDRGSWLGLSTSQLIGVLLVIAAYGGHRVMAHRAAVP